VTLYLSIEQVEELHRIQIQTYGGGSGCRDSGGLEADIVRPVMTFGGEGSVPDVAAKAAALVHSLVANHPFVDGNKCVGAHAAFLFLELNDHVVTATPLELEDITMELASGTVDIEALTVWFRQRISACE
jgi:death-on-curing protein